ncbi:MAG: hypothetical protein V7701_13895 [Sneathiella sp.]
MQQVGIDVTEMIQSMPEPVFNWGEDVGPEDSAGAWRFLCGS